ncbi:MAG: hypothetical protein IJV14_10840 [Lachnospiraceae bacterium]|nr:hypothetical protein [Lachnospiraceae bacterium]
MLRVGDVVEIMNPHEIAGKGIVLSEKYAETLSRLRGCHCDVLRIEGKYVQVFANDTTYVLYKNMIKKVSMPRFTKKDFSVVF